MIHLGSRSNTGSTFGLVPKTVFRIFHDLFEKPLTVKNVKSFTDHFYINIEDLKTQIAPLSGSTIFCLNALKIALTPPPDRMHLLLLPNNSILELSQIAHTEFFRFRT